jgi:hypothetical protein
MATRHRFRTEVWMHDGPAAWFFASLPPELADDLEAAHGDRAAGFGSLRVEVTIGATTWRTSIFPDTRRATYVLPVKKAVRVSERLADGSPVEIVLEVLV